VGRALFRVARAEIVASRAAGDAAGPGCRNEPTVRARSPQDDLVPTETFAKLGEIVGEQRSTELLGTDLRRLFALR
jgi:hypothetical protein